MARRRGKIRGRRDRKPAAVAAPLAGQPVGSGPESISSVTRLRRLTSRGALFMLGAVVIAAITFVVNDKLTTASESARTAKQNSAPVSIDVTETGEQPSFIMLVRDPARLPALPSSYRCGDLYSAGAAAGGVSNRIYDDIRNILLTGKSDEGIVLNGITARTTGRGPSNDGVLLVCEAQGELTPVEYTFDLSKAANAVAMRRAEDSIDLVDVFAAGTVVTVRHGDAPVPLHVRVVLPTDVISWHLEAKVVGRDNPLIIDDHGKDFTTFGRRPFNGYESGYTFASQYVDKHGLAWWGVEKGAVVVGSGPEQRLRLGPVSVQTQPGLDFYLAYPTNDDSAGEANFVSARFQPHFIRLDARPLVSFAATSDVGFPAVDGFCTLPGERDGNASLGTVRKSDVVQREVLRRTGAPLVHTVVTYACKITSGSAIGPAVGSVVSRRLETWSTATSAGKADPAGSTFWIWQDEISQSDLALAHATMQTLTVASSA